jgi:hypothetical protein
MSIDKERDEPDRRDDSQDVVGDEGGAEPLGSPSRVSREGGPPRDESVPAEAPPPGPRSQRSKST